MRIILFLYSVVCLLPVAVYGEASLPFGPGKSIELGGKIFTNFLSANNITQGSRYLLSGRPGGLNGTTSELELNLKVSFSEYVRAGACIKSRYNENDWSTYWNNDDLEGSQYMKLRGVWLRFQTPEWARPAVKTVHMGSSDLGDFSPFTIGKIRYIDRDNAMGVFLYGSAGKVMTYTLGRIALPSVWAGPGWSTEGRRFQSPFSAQDYAHALALNFTFSPEVALRLTGDYIHDLEGLHDSEDETQMETRYENTVGHMDLALRPALWFDCRVQGAYSGQNYDDRVSNISRSRSVYTGTGYNSVPERDLSGGAGIATFNFTSLLDQPLGFSLEYFNIGEHFVSIMAARRESDVLITEGFEDDDIGWDAGGWTGGETQVPTINVDNNESQFNETLGGREVDGSIARSIIGWNGGTLVGNWAPGPLDTRAEYTYITYNTNMQDRNMAFWPGNQGFGFPDNAYNRDQERTTQIVALRATWHLDVHRGLDLTGRVKYLDDEDLRDERIPADNFRMRKLVSEGMVKAQIVDEVSLNAGVTYYDNDIMDAGQDLSYDKIRYFTGGDFLWKGIKIAWLAERFEGKWWNRFEQVARGVSVIEKTEEFRFRAFAEFAF